MRTLVLAEPASGLPLSPATLGAVGAAARVGGKIDLLVAGGEGGGAERGFREAARIRGISTLRCSVAAHYAEPSPENIAALIQHIALEYSHILAPSTAFWKSALPRVAAILDVAQISGVLAIESPDTFVRALYSGSVWVRLRSSDPVKVMSIQATAFEPATVGAEEARIERLPALPDLKSSRIVSRKAGESGRQGVRPDLASARVVITGGRGLGSAEAYRRLLEPLADRLGAALGATRAAVDAGFASNDTQIGQTGKVVAPSLYIAAGVSGAIQHLVGMKDSQTLVAIDIDADAPLLQMADCALVADLSQALPELLNVLGDKQ